MLLRKTSAVVSHEGACSNMPAMRQRGTSLRGIPLSQVTYERPRYSSIVRHPDVLVRCVQLEALVRRPFCRLPLSLVHPERLLAPSISRSFCADRLLSDQGPSLPVLVTAERGSRPLFLRLSAQLVQHLEEHTHQQ